MSSEDPPQKTELRTFVEQGDAFMGTHLIYQPILQLITQVQ